MSLETFLPWAVAVSADKHIFVVDNGGRLQKFSFSFLSPVMGYALAVHPTSGKVFCTNCIKCNIT